MTTGLVQFASTGNGPENSVTLANPTTAGNLLVVVVSLDTGTSQPASVTLTGSSDVFTRDAAAANTNPTSNINLSIWSDPDCTGGLTTVVSSGNAGNTIQAVFEISGTAHANAVAAAAAAAPASTLQTAFDSGAAGAAEAGAFWVGAVAGIGSGGRATAVPAGSWTLENPMQPGSATQVLVAYQAGAAAGAPEYAGTFSGPSAGAYWVAAVGAYNPPAASVPAAPAVALAGDENRLNPFRKLDLLRM